MTKQDIVDTVAEATGLTKVETEAVMNGVMATIIDSLGRNERVELRGFGTFGVKHRMPKKPEILEQVKQFICLRDMCRLLSRLNICVYM